MGQELCGLWVDSGSIGLTLGKVSDACGLRFFIDFLGVSPGLYEKTDEMHMILASICIVWNHSFWRLWGRPGTSILGGFGGPGTSILGVFWGTHKSHPFLPLFSPS